MTLQIWLLSVVVGMFIVDMAIVIKRNRETKKHLFAMIEHLKAITDENRKLEAENKALRQKLALHEDS